MVGIAVLACAAPFHILDLWPIIGAMLCGGGVHMICPMIWMNVRRVWPPWPFRDKKLEGSKSSKEI